MLEVSFVKRDTLRRVKHDAEVRAFDADGNEHRFTPEAHVSLAIELTLILLLTKCASLTVS